MFIKKLAFAVAITGSLFLAGCDNSDNAKTSANKIKVAVVSGPEVDLTETIKKQAKELYNLDVELVVFDDYVTPNQALNDGLIDVNAFQHEPYLEKQTQERGFKLAIVGNTLVYPIAAYSKKLKPTNSNNAENGKLVTSPRGTKYFIKKGASIAIPNDPTNLGRSLLLLQAYGLITVDASKGIFPAVTDITKNDLNLKIVEIDGPLLTHSLDDDKIDLAIINNTFAGIINLVPDTDGILVENKESPYVNIIVSRDDNQNDPNVINFVKAYQAEATIKKANEIFKGAVVKGW